MKCVPIERLVLPLTYLSQGCKDVEERLGDLKIWLAKLKDSITSTRADDNREEAERFGQLTKFVSYPHPLTDSSRSSILVP